MLVVKHLARRLVDDVAVNAGLAGGVRPQQCAVAQQIDAPRHPARQFVDACNRLLVKRHLAHPPGNGQPVADVVHRFLLGERWQMKTRNHPLGELLHVGPGQHGAQLGLADQHDLQQLAFAGFQVGQEAQLLDDFGRQVLCLVDDEHVVLAGGVGLEQKRVERVHMVGHRGVGLAPGRVVDVKFVVDGAQQLDHGELGIEDVGDVAVLGNLLQKGAAHRGLAGTDFAGEQHKAATPAQSVQQMGQRLAVPLAHEQITRVRRYGKGAFLQPEKFYVHGYRKVPRQANANRHCARKQRSAFRTPRWRVGPVLGAFDLLLI